MSEMLSIGKKIILDYPEIVTWGVASIMLILGVALQYKAIKNIFSEQRLNYLIKKAGRDSAHNIVIQDGLEGQVFIEHLILTPGAIILLGIKRYQGLIFAANTIEFWTQVVGKKSYKFKNPLHQLEYDESVLNAHMKNSKIEAKVLFVDGSQFPKDKPDNVVSVEELQQWRISDAEKEIPENLKSDWKRLQKLIDKNTSFKGGNVLTNSQDTSGLNMLSLISSVSIILIWLLWRLQN